MTDSFTELAGVAELGLDPRASEEDVKITIVLPLLRALGYLDADFGYEGRTGRGYVDISGTHFPVGIVVETKGPRKKLQDAFEQLERYIFEKHGRDRATIAILTNGELFQIFGITSALFRGSLAEHELERFNRQHLSSAELGARLNAILNKQRNQSGTLFATIAARQAEVRQVKERIQAIEAELKDLGAQREEIDNRIQGLQLERGSLLGSLYPAAPAVAFPIPLASVVTFPGTEVKGATHVASGDFGCPASDHILRLLREQRAISRESAKTSKWLAQQLIGKVDGVATRQAVSFGVIELRDDRHLVLDEMKRGDRWIWLK